MHAGVPLIPCRKTKGMRQGPLLLPNRSSITINPYSLPSYQPPQFIIRPNFHPSPPQSTTPRAEVIKLKLKLRKGSFPRNQWEPEKAFPLTCYASLRVVPGVIFKGNDRFRFREQFEPVLIRLSLCVSVPQHPLRGGSCQEGNGWEDDLHATHLNGASPSTWERHLLLHEGTGTNDHGEKSPFTPVMSTSS